MGILKEREKNKMKNITIQRTALNSKESIMNIIASAKESIRLLNIEQWSGEYPSENDIEQDIKSNNGYIIVLGDYTVGYWYIDGACDDYANDSCKWKMDTHNYISVHRFAINKNYQGKGLASFGMNFIIDEYKNKNCDAIRIDTHYDNVPMRKMIELCNFQQCGEFVISEGDEKGQTRVCYEYILS